MNTEEYIKFLRTRVIPFRNRFYNGARFIFQDDSAPAHRAKRVTEFKRANDIVSLTWPGNSPDLNPVENLWAILKKKVTFRKPKTKSELIASIINVWHHHISSDLLLKLATSMPQRISAVLKNKGAPTKF